MCLEWYVGRGEGCEKYILIEKVGIECSFGQFRNVIEIIVYVDLAFWADCYSCDVQVICFVSLIYLMQVAIGSIGCNKK